MPLKHQPSDSKLFRDKTYIDDSRFAVTTGADYPVSDPTTGKVSVRVPDRDGRHPTRIG